METPDEMQEVSRLLREIRRLLNDLAHDGLYGSLEIKLGDGCVTLVRDMEGLKVGVNTGSDVVLNKL